VHEGGSGEPVLLLLHGLGANDAFTVPVQAVIGLGIKVAWTAEELDRAQAAAHRLAARQQPVTGINARSRHMIALDLAPEVSTGIVADALPPRQE
jgi:hypothetical protein